jgi:hypothetical protein
VTILEVSVTQAATTAPGSSPWYVSSAPPRQRLHVIVVETIVSFIALGIVAGLTVLTREPWLIPPLAASLTLVIGGAHFPLSQPRNVMPSAASPTSIQPGCLINSPGRAPSDLRSRQRSRKTAS